MVLAGALAGLAACGPRGGIQLDIDATKDPGATEVRVYVGSEDGLGTSIAGEGLLPSMSHDGKYWPLTFHAAEDVKLSGSDTVTVGFEAGDGVEKLTIVVVGLTGGVQTSVARKLRAPLRTDAFEIWKLTLEPAGTDVEVKTGKAVAWWGTEPGESTCVQAVDRSDPLQNVFIGIPDDKDCDGYEANTREECDDTWHNADAVPSQATLSCLEPQKVTDPLASLPADVCMFGAFDCTDGKGEGRIECSHAPPFCAPQGLCSQCAGATPEDRFACALQLDPLQAPVLSARCKIQVDVGATPPRLCDQELVVAPPPGSFMVQTSCAGPALFHLPDRDASWSSTAEIGNVSLAFSPGGTLSACDVRIIPKEIAGRSFDRGEFPGHGLVSVDIDPGAGVVLPVTFELIDVTACQPDANCTLSQLTANETVGKCARFAPDEP